MRQARGLSGAAADPAAGRSIHTNSYRDRRRFGLAAAAIAAVIAGCTYGGPITSTLMLDGDEAYLPSVDSYAGPLSTAANGLAVRPGDVLLLSQQTFPPSGTLDGEYYGRRAPSDLGTLRLPLRMIGLNVGETCDQATNAENALSPSEQLLISTLLVNARQKYSYQDDEFVEISGGRGLAWGTVKDRFLRVLEKCGGRLWNTLVDGMWLHALRDSNERLIVSVDLEAMRNALPETWHEQIPASDNPNGLTPRHVFGYVFIDGYGHAVQRPPAARIELSTLSGPAVSTFSHVLGLAGDQETYGDVFGRDIDGEFRPRFTPRHRVVLNGVDFRSKDLNRDELHWTLKEVEDSMICVGRNEDGGLLARTIVSLRPDGKDRALTLFDDRDGTRKPQLCDITVGLTSVPDGAAAERGRTYLGSKYFDYPFESQPINPDERFGNPEVCGPTWIWRVNKGAVAHASRVLEHVPVHTVSELVWNGALASVDQKPSVSDRCLVK